jgi:hypothetical protein
METKFTRRAGRCGYRFDSAIKRQCKAKTRKLIQLQDNKIKNGLTVYEIKWQHRCRNHDHGKFING